MASLVDTTMFEKYTTGDAQTYLDGASAAVQSYCGWHIAPVKTDETLTIDGRGGSHLWLPSKHVVNVSAVTVSGVLVDSTEYDWSEDGFLELRCGSFPTRARSITVTLTHGYAAVPADVAQVVMEVSARAKASPAGALREQAGQVSVDHGRIRGGLTPGGALLAEEMARLDPYKLPTRVV